MKRIEIDPAAPYAGFGLLIIGATLFGFGIGATASVPIFFGLVMLFLGLFVLVGLVRENKQATHRRR